MTHWIFFIIYHLKGGFIDTGQETGYKLGRVFPGGIVIPFRVFVGDFPSPNYVGVISLVNFICMDPHLVHTYICSPGRRLGETCINIMDSEIVRLSNMLDTQLVFIEKGLIHGS